MKDEILKAHIRQKAHIIARLSDLVAQIGALITEEEEDASLEQRKREIEANLEGMKFAVQQFESR